MISTRIFGTPVRAKGLVVIFIFAAVWGVVTGLEFHWHPERGFWQGLLIGLVATLLLLTVEFGHTLAHIFSARYAGAPMDEILITADMPRTLYSNNDVSPDVHRLRALGGPIYNLVGLLLSLGIYAVASRTSIVKELAGWWAAGHGLQLIMSLSPLPFVDGGTILKWTLVERGKTEREADALIRQIDWGLGILIVMIGIGFLFMRTWMIGGILLSVGGIVFGIAAGKIQ